MHVAGRDDASSLLPIAPLMSSLFPAREQRFTPDAVRLLQQQRRADISKAKVELGYAPTDLRTAVHDAYADFARRGLVPGGPTMVTVPGAAAKTSTPSGSKGDTAAA